MPADYHSTAQALALPVSPPRSPTLTRQPSRAAWSRRQSNLSHSGSRSPFNHGEPSFRNKVLDNAERVQRHVYRTVKKLTPLQRILAGFAVVAALVTGVLFLVFNERIFAWLEPFAERWKNTKGGWLILWAMTFATAFPPLIGYSTCVTIAGFVYRFPEGWFIVASATVIGSLCSFMVSRTVLSRFVHRLVENDKRFAAFSLVLKHDGLKLLIMIRLCPLPYSLSNGALSTVPTVQPPVFALATAMASPKLMIHIFIGSRLAAIAKSGEKMDAGTKAINYASIVGGMILGAATGYFIYQRTVARSRELEAEERASLRHSASQSGRGADFSDDPEEQVAAAAILRDDDIDFLDNEETRPGYRDEFTDDEDDVFRHGDGDDEEAIGMSDQLTKK
ncbi:MAG: hypothetical protein FRX48_00306 [Lasallia pustulata]|uniref:Golgi apparatus membrane protein TVP38 n=1 Tax=Lasallia pustulata TaxID=136370 RepID=A0A5M8Q2F3_9LECA|nr:MAG: hypothetical protein FRX48_00306 [Lasallia pustulata]